MCQNKKNGCLCNGHRLQSKVKGCPVCGSKLTNIRGKHPGEPEREVCATCLQERWDTILEMADSSFHIACAVEEAGLPLEELDNKV